MGTYAIVNDRGRRFTARPGEEVWIDYRADLKDGEKVTFDQVEFISRDGGATVGTPNVAGAKVVASVKSEERGKKIIVFKYRRRKSERRKHGSRAFYTCIAIESVG